MNRILFFDDEPITTQFLISHLREYYHWKPDGYGDITFVSTFEDLFKQVETVNYNLVVLDIMVPINTIKKTGTFSPEEIVEMLGGDNTGVVIAKKIRSLANYKDVPVLFLSARVKPKQMLGNSDYLEKPVLAQTVSDKMKEMMNL